MLWNVSSDEIYSLESTGLNYKRLREDLFYTPRTCFHALDLFIATRLYSSLFLSPDDQEEIASLGLFFPTSIVLEMWNAVETSFVSGVSAWKLPQKEKMEQFVRNSMTAILERAVLFQKVSHF